LAHDVDVDGVDLTLVHDHAVIPLQLKSHGGKKTSSWDVRRRIPFPQTFTRLHEALFDEQSASTEGLGGGLVVQKVMPLSEWPYARLWYRLAQLDLVYLRSQT